MAKKAKEEKEYPITLDEFCRLLSVEDKRVELISGFHAEERARRVIKDTRSAFQERLDKFLRRPV